MPDYLSILPDAEQMSAEASAAFRIQDWNRAAHLYALLCDRDPEQELHWVRAASALRVAHKLEEADEILAKAVLTRPDSLVLASEYARNAARLRNVDEAIRRWRSVVLSFPKEQSN